LPKTEKLLKQLISGSDDSLNELKMIDTFYKKYKNELLLHIKEEEDKVFPYVTGLVSKKIKSKSAYSIKSFEQEHTNVDMKLNDLKNLIIKYIEPKYNDNDCNEFLFALFQFEKDLKDHARIEDKILVPKVMILEKDMSI
jgi:regulator of cell morphogenesis and NO signaling